ncbi:undecaprenyl-phosphate glucose phosphotransferase [Criibacterium bergeronii]|uniref:undecaprenyl-phosphate glucose phosphotransferase n=1 Tax=Criibacterium bergeronii TaxID=1871336 RepID=UPI001FAA257D|nr:undecaprenyl-phosphate glucose phosphotransferase [Criibacterium bergeronii]
MNKLIKENQRLFNFINLVLDALMIVIAFLLAYYTRTQSDLLPYQESITFYEYLRYLVIILPIFIACYFWTNVYTPQRLKSITNEIFRLARANVIATAIYFVILFIIKDIDFSRFLVFIFLVYNVALTSLQRMALRYTLRYFRAKGYNIKNAILIGSSDTAMDFLKKTQENLYWGYKILAIFEEKIDEKKQARLKKEHKLKYVDRYELEKLEDYLKKRQIDEIMIGLSLNDYSHLQDIVRVCEKSGVKTQIIPDYIKFIPAQPEVEQIDDITIINIRKVPLENPINKFIKRSFDLFFSIILLIVLSPLMLIVAILIKLDSKGPVFFIQERIGYNRKKFNMYKFRSMRAQDKNEEKSKWTVKNDDRKTKIGAFIRKTNIDELPQLFNVIKGDMSLIGPRPERPFFVEKFKEQIPKYMVKHQVRPGITGLAQSLGYRGDTSITKRIEHDIFYIENWTLSLDIKIILLTMKNAFKNAY